MRRFSTSFMFRATRKVTKIRHCADLQYVFVEQLFDPFFLFNIFRRYSDCNLVFVLFGVVPAEVYVSIVLCIFCGILHQSRIGKFLHIAFMLPMNS